MDRDAVVVRGVVAVDCDHAGIRTTSHPRGKVHSVLCVLDLPRAVSVYLRMSTLHPITLQHHIVSHNFNCFGSRHIQRHRRKER